MEIVEETTANNDKDELEEPRQADNVRVAKSQEEEEKEKIGSDIDQDGRQIEIRTVRLVRNVEKEAHHHHRGVGLGERTLKFVKQIWVELGHINQEWERKRGERNPGEPWRGR